MKITKCSSDIVKTAQAEPVAASSNARDNAGIAQAIERAAQDMGLNTNIVSMGKLGEEQGFVVYCNGRRGEMEIKYIINPYGTLDGKVVKGMEHGDGPMKIMREILANACAESGIAAMPLSRKQDSLLSENPNHYADLAAQYGTAGNTEKKQ